MKTCDVHLAAKEPRELNIRWSHEKQNKWTRDVSRSEAAALALFLYLNCPWETFADLVQFLCDLNGPLGAGRLLTQLRAIAASPIADGWYWARHNDTPWMVMRRCNAKWYLNASLYTPSVTEYRRIEEPLMNNE
jgi:hypothetical protein